MISLLILTSKLKLFLLLLLTLICIVDETVQIRGTFFFFLSLARYLFRPSNFFFRFAFYCYVWMS
jgi:hypothetical protein